MRSRPSFRAFEKFQQYFALCVCVCHGPIISKLSSVSCVRRFSISVQKDDYFFSHVVACAGALIFALMVTICKVQCNEGFSIQYAWENAKWNETKWNRLNVSVGIFPWCLFFVWLFDFYLDSDERCRHTRSSASNVFQKMVRVCTLIIKRVYMHHKPVEWPCVNQSHFAPKRKNILRLDCCICAFVHVSNGKREKERERHV